MKYTLFTHTQTHPLCLLTHSYTWTHVLHLYTKIILFTYGLTNSHISLAHIFNTLFLHNHTICTYFSHTLWDYYTYWHLPTHMLIHTFKSHTLIYLHAHTHTHTHTTRTFTHAQILSMHTSSHPIHPHIPPHTNTHSNTHLNITLIDTQFTY